METIVYYSRNAKKPPFEVTIELDGEVAYINCNCPLGLETKICRHKINAIRGDKQKRHQSTSDEVITRLRRLFGTSSSLRQHLEEKWRSLREFASDHPENEEEIANKRRLLGEAFANGFLNKSVYKPQEPFDADKWEDSRETIIDGINCPVTLKYVNHEGIVTKRDVLVNEVFSSNSNYYIMGYCSLREQQRTFRVDRIQGIDFGSECTTSNKSIILDVVFQGNP